MRGGGNQALAAALAVVLAGCAGGGTAAGAARDPVGLALAHLAREVPRWPAENGCFSCHHSGDAARALFTARRLARQVPGASGADSAALASTLAWLSRPEGWKDQKDDPAFSDEALARLQFAAALSAALEAGLVRRGRATEAAGDLVAAVQGEDGAWVIGSGGALGSPATWGTQLATAMACRTLETLDARRHERSIERARSWLRVAPVQNVLEAGAILLGLGPAEGPEGQRREAVCLSLIERGRAPGGGWGPYLNAPPEPFDTAVVLLALSRLPRTPATEEWIREGRAHLRSTQHPDGGWDATTRPRGRESYAQATSTAGWAALALLLTEGA